MVLEKDSICDVEKVGRAGNKLPGPSSQQRGGEGGCGWHISKELLSLCRNNLQEKTTRVFGFWLKSALA